MQDLQDFDKAIEIYKDLNIDYPNQFEIVLALVQAYSQSNQLDKAVNLLENWISKNPNDPQALEYLNILKDIS
jgi:tetratricopeptide (TPR) repeat protein